MRMEISCARHSDIEGMHAIESATWLSDAASKDSLKRRIELFSEGFLVARTGGEVTGFVNSARLDKDIVIKDFNDLSLFERIFRKDGSIFYIYSLQVGNEYRKRGIARELIKNLIETAKRTNGIQKIWLVGSDEETSIGFATTPVYQRWGFRIIKKFPDYLNGKPGSLLEMAV